MKWPLKTLKGGIINTAENEQSFFKVNLLFVMFDHPGTDYPPANLTYCM